MPLHETVELIDPFTGRSFPADQGMVEDLQRLWAAGIQTFMCCQGDELWMHERYVCIRRSDIERARELLDWAVHVDKPSLTEKVTGWVALRDRHLMAVGMLTQEHHIGTFVQWAQVDAALCECS